MSNKDMPAMTSDQCRELAKKHGITLHSVGMDGVNRLHRILCRHVYASDLFGGTYGVQPIRKKDIYRDGGKPDGNINSVELHVSAHYFNRREAITFNRDGFIGFCGWSDSTNSQPIYAAFVEWCAEIAEAALAELEGRDG
jgi:hypothetical protein